MGCDSSISHGTPRAGQFQSTHPHGVRRQMISHDSEGIHFNPRTRMGCDLSNVKQHYDWNDFNPRTRMGCDI